MKRNKTKTKTRSKRKTAEITHTKTLPPKTQIEELDMICRGIVGLTGIAVGLSLLIAPFLIIGAVSRVADEVRDRIPFFNKCV